MNQTLLLLFVFALSSVSAQTALELRAKHDRHQFQENLADRALRLPITLTVSNTSDSALCLRWQRFELDMPNAWETQISDGNTTFASHISSNISDELHLSEPISLAPGAQQEIYLYVIPNGVEGTAQLAIDFSSAERPSRVLRTQYLDVAVQQHQRGSDPAIAHADVLVFPNPTSDYIELKNGEFVDQVLITNIIGRELRQYDARSGDQFSLSGLPNGVYLVSLINNDLGLIRTVRVSKRSLRP